MQRCICPDCFFIEQQQVVVGEDFGFFEFRIRLPHFKSNLGFRPIYQQNEIRAEANIFALPLLCALNNVSLAMALIPFAKTSPHDQKHGCPAILRTQAIQPPTDTFFYSSAFFEPRCKPSIFDYRANLIRQ